MKKAVYRNNIIQRMGGESGFDFLLATYCENIQDDERLDRFFGNFNLNTLICLQKEFLLISFLEPNGETEPRKKRVMFRNDMMGVDGSAFLLLEQHFVDALEDCCFGGLDLELCKAYFSELQALFKESANHSKYRENIVERMGGESTFEFLVLSFCDRLEEDERLSCYFDSLSSEEMTLLQKELILMSFLNPNANSGFEGLRRRVTSSYGRLLELGMNEEHFETMMKSHFSAAVYECLTETDVIQGCMRLFANLVTFFEDNSGYDGDYDDEEEDIESVTEFDSGDEEDNSLCSLSEYDAAQSPIPLPEVARGGAANRFQDSLSQSERSLDGTIFSIRSFESRTPTTENASHVSKRIQEALEKSSERYSRTHYISKKPIQDGTDGWDVSMHSERTADTLSIRSGDSQPCIQQTQAKLPKKGRTKMSFSWKTVGPCSPSSIRRKINARRFQP